MILNPRLAETDDSKSPSAPSEPEENLPPQRFTTGLSSASATREQRLLEGTVHQQLGGTVLAEVHRLLSEDQPKFTAGKWFWPVRYFNQESPVEVVVHANLQHQSSADDLSAGALDTPDSVVVSLPTELATTYRLAGIN